MKTIQIKDLKNSGSIAEVQASYSTKVKVKDRVSVTNSKDAEKYIRPAFEHVMEYREMAAILLLNRKNHVLGWVCIGEGGLNEVNMDPKIIFQIALRANASAIVVAHNHPSGGLVPSNADIEVTKKIVEAGKLIDIQVLDHLIITAESYQSLADEGLM